jgi:hypothetical protein
MKYVNNEHASQDPNVSVRSDRGIFIQRRALILGILAYNCLLIIVGLGLGTFATNTPLLQYLLLLPPFAFLLSLVFFNSYFFKDNPRLRRASKGTFGSYRKSIIGLDEREKLVIDQAFRTSYRILALVGYLLAICLIINNIYLHLAYRLGSAGTIWITLGVLCLLIYLPSYVVAWHERVWVQKEETLAR